MKTGNAVQFQSKLGWIFEIIDDAQSNVFTIGAGGLQPNRKKISIAWENLTTSTDLSEHIVEPWLYPMVLDKEREEVGALWKAAKEAEAAEIDARRTAGKELANTQKEWRDSIRDKIPTDAKAVIIAQLKVDKCDAMTDYFGSSTSETVILAFSRHTRDLFPEMRKAALNFEATASLADGPKDFEHREKWSMGGGYYLKDGWRHRDGWQVSKQTMYGGAEKDIAEKIPCGTWCVPDGQPFVTGAKPREAGAKNTAPADSVASVDGFTIEEHTHTKRGFQMFIAYASERVDRDTFTAWLAKAKELGGWYSRKWGSTPAGFAFKEEETAKEFAASLKELAA